MLTITKLRGAEYLLRSVADGVEDYFMGVGEAPGIWHGRWASALGVSGVVEADQLRALVEGQHPLTGEPLLAGHKEREVKALDLTFSSPKSVSLLWAFGDPATKAEVSIAMSSAATRALEFMEAHAAVTRRQVDGVRRRVGTEGFAVATFTHRTSRAGDPQLHMHCLVPNVVERDDGVHVAIDAQPMHTWLKASGTIFQAELQRQLTERLEVTWGPERNGTRELVGFHPKQLRAFSKRTAAIETVLEAGPEAVTAKERMQADDRASLQTRDRKDRNLTPEVLRERWADEAARAGISTGARLVRTLRHQTTHEQPTPEAELFGALVAPETGVCATRARFTHAHVIERVAALSVGRWTTEEIESLADAFLASDLVVRLAVGKDGAGRRRPQEWSTVEHRRLEDRVLASLDVLRRRTEHGTSPRLIGAGVAANAFLGDDQRAAVQALCGPGRSLRVVLAAAGHGKTALTATAAGIATDAGRPVVALATTNKAVAELHGAGMAASTIARWRRDGATLAAGSVVVLDEVSQVSTRDAAAVLDAVLACPGATLWCLGDEDQGRSVAPGGLAAELARLAERDEVTTAELTVNRRQRHPAEREALADYRAGHLEASQTTRAEHGWEHTATSSEEIRDALATAAVEDMRRYGAADVVVLAVSHADCEDVADRIRARLESDGLITGRALTGPGWNGGERAYAAGDRILLHAPIRLGDDRVPAGSTATVTAVDPSGMALTFDGGRAGVLTADVVAGHRPDGTPNVSHAWARTIDGAQGGTWEQAHVLATPNVDRHTLYVAQSRGRRPTHTWNTLPAVDAEAHGNVVTDPRTPDEQVLAAASRVPENRFAADDDPHVLDRQLRTERAEHEAVLASGPPDRSAAARSLAAKVERLEQEARRAWDHLGAIDRRLDATSGLRRLRPDARREHHDLEARRGRAVERLDEAQQQLREARTLSLRSSAAADERRRWVEANRWRHHEIARIDHQLDLHWCRTVIGAIEDGDPLAFGLDRLRDAHRSLRGHRSTAPERERRAVADALAELRVERLESIDRDGPIPDHLRDALGPLPTNAMARRVWLGCANAIEADADRRSPESIDSSLHRSVIEVAKRVGIEPVGDELSGPAAWSDALERAQRLREVERSMQARSADRGLGISL